MSDTSTMSPDDTQVIQIDGFVKTTLIVIAIILGILGASKLGVQAKAEEEKRVCGMHYHTPCLVRVIP
ncbi:MAG: hypothetical protein ACAH80_02130 [Alphaproteobacteria bacterium]